MSQSSKIVTQKDVARLAGVSRSVVSYVLNDGPRSVAPKTKRRVLEAIDALGYHPNKNAQRLKMGPCSAQRCTGIIAGGQSFGVLEHAYYNSMLSGLLEEAHQMGQEIRFFSYLEAFGDPIFFNKYIHSDEISSLILILPAIMDPIPDAQKILDQIARRVKNVVCLGGPIEGWPTINYDHKMAAQQAMAHLIALGHRRIAHLGIRDERLTGYRENLEKFRLPYDESLVAIPDPADIYNTSYQMTEQLLQVSPRPTALFTASDEIAISAMAALHDHGVIVPQDIAIASIDNIKVAKVIRPALTTVNVPRRQMAALAMQVLKDGQKNQKPKAGTYILPTELIIRDSSGGMK